MKYRVLIIRILKEKLFVVTSDFKLLYKVLQTKIDDVEFIHQLPQEKKNNNGRIITDSRLYPASAKVLRINRNMTTLQIKKRIIHYLSKLETRWDLIFGIDPGLNIGVALLHKKQLVDSTIVLSMDSLVKWIRFNIISLQATSVLVRIGDGVKEPMNRIINRLIREFRTSIQIEIVDEKNTSIKQKNDITIHEQAATRIANRRGREYEP